MKISDFFVGLGFDVSGDDALEKIDRQLGGLLGNASKLLGVFASMTAAMGVMLNKTLDTAEGFRRFTAVTDLSANELKRWQFAAKQAGTEAGEVEATIKSLQQARADIMMGTGNMAPWQLLGIAPGENPFKTLREIKERIKDLDPAVARSVLSQMGIGEGMFAMLRLSNREFDELNKKFELTAEQEGNLAGINTQWAKFKFEISAVRDRIVAELVPALQPVIKFLSKIVGLLGNFAEWLNKGSTAAQYVKVAMVAIAGSIVAITLALTALVGVLGLATVATAALDLAAAPLMPVIWGITLAVLAVVAAITAAVLIVQDLWVAFQGGDSVIANMVNRFQMLATVLSNVIGPFGKVLQMAGVWNKYEKFKEQNGEEQQASGKGTGFMDVAKMALRLISPFSKSNPEDSLRDAALDSGTARGGSTQNVNQENNISITVPAGRDAHETGQAIVDPLKKAISDGAFQIPIPAQ